MSCPKAKEYSKSLVIIGRHIDHGISPRGPRNYSLGLCAIGNAVLGISISDFPVWLCLHVGLLNIQRTIHATQAQWADLAIAVST